MPKRAETVQYLVTVRNPKAYSKEDVRKYIEEAICMWGGQRHPYDELFSLCDDAKVTLSHMKKEATS